jgi:hypothetical protein
MKRERIAEPKHKKATPIPVSKTPVAEGFREQKRATGSVIIVGEHIATMWEASQRSKPKGNHPDHLRRRVGIALPWSAQLRQRTKATSSRSG